MGQLEDEHAAIAQEQARLDQDRKDLTAQSLPADHPLWQMLLKDKDALQERRKQLTLLLQLEQSKGPAAAPLAAPLPAPPAAPLPAPPMDHPSNTAHGPGPRRGPVPSLPPHGAAHPNAAASPDAIAQHVRLLHRATPKVAPNKAVLRDLDSSRLPGSHADPIDARLCLALEAVGVPKATVATMAFSDAPEAAGRDSGQRGGAAATGTAAVPSRLALEATPKGYSDLLAAAPALAKQFGVMVSPYLTDYGIALRRQRQPVFDGLMREGCNPRWRDGVRILFTRGGRDQFYQFELD